MGLASSAGGDPPPPPEQLLGQQALSLPSRSSFFTANCGRLASTLPWGSSLPVVFPPPAPALRTPDLLSQPLQLTNPYLCLATCLSLIYRILLVLLLWLNPSCYNELKLCQ